MAGTCWEYTYVQSGQLDATTLRAGLNALGSLGWECIAITNTDRMIGLNGLVAVMRREATPLPAPADTAPAWHADPLGRADHRYWDGIRWTEQVNRGGQVCEDYPTRQPVAVSFLEPHTS